MPPKPKYTKEEIVMAALNLVARGGADALTAKELGNALGMSTSPIFTVFDSMQEVQIAVKAAAMERFASYAHITGKNMPLFKQIGMQMILFAKQEPCLYQLLFMSPNPEVHSFDDIYLHLGAVADECLHAIQEDYALTYAQAHRLFEHVWIHTYGIGALCATGMCTLPGEAISEMLTQDFTAMMLLLKREAEA